MLMIDTRISLTLAYLREKATEAIEALDCLFEGGCVDDIRKSREIAYYLGRVAEQCGYGNASKDLLEIEILSRRKLMAYLDELEATLKTIQEHDNIQQLIHEDNVADYLRSEDYLTSIGITQEMYGKFTTHFNIDIVGAIDQFTTTATFVTIEGVHFYIP